MQARHFVSFVAVGAALAGCAKPPPPVVAAPEVLKPHLGPPRAAYCVVGNFRVADGGTAVIDMRVSNEGGYCAAALTAASGRPFDAPLVPVLPLHGRVSVVKYSGKTSVEYTPNPGFAGSDKFTVKLIVRGVPGYTTLNVGVTVK